MGSCINIYFSRKHVMGLHENCHTEAVLVSTVFDINMGTPELLTDLYKSICFWFLLKYPP